MIVKWAEALFYLCIVVIVIMTIIIVLSSLFDTEFCFVAQASLELMVWVPRDVYVSPTQDLRPEDRFRFEASLSYVMKT